MTAPRDIPQESNFKLECVRLIQERDAAQRDLNAYRDAAQAESAELRAERLALLAERDALRAQVAEMAGALRIISDETEDSTAEYAAKVARTVLDKVAL